ncbi:SIR2 family protein [Candidatus Methylobacter oryzae]|uniref:SIR2-like domain-containing protein n=1 Tax=Candidatus Methylobacter oryzae TaxID=2497749 RepID=A0ABY3CC03_9GAMM|nr:SIR2 family protein [Candidatus Methylobacter oryzae]TRW97201.1 hypothetical protein EKO24_007690 [Candidatus Methylobacter oryzae]
MDTFNQSPPVPPEIIDAAQDGSLVLFIGAGISRLVGCPSWDGFAWQVLEQLTPSAMNYHEQKLIRSIPDPRKQLSLAKIIENDAGQSKVDYHEIFDKPLSEENVYKYINQYSCSFVTTNYDKFIKPEYVRGKAEQNWRFYERSDLLASKLDVRGNVVHLHGCIDNHKSMVVTTKDYLNHYSSNEVPKFLKHLFSKKTVLFLGYGMEELEILEYVLKSSDQQGQEQKRLFILQGSFNADYSLFEKLKKFYNESFNAELIGFSLDKKNYNQQVEIIKKWGEQLTFGDQSLIDEAAAMEDELNG